MRFSSIMRVDKKNTDVEHVENPSESYPVDEKQGEEFIENVEAETLEQLGTTRKDMRSLIAKTWALNMMLGWAYMIMYTDKYILSTAAILGIKDPPQGWKGGLHMSTYQFSWSSSSTYFGYLVAEIPLSLLVVKKCGPRWTGIVMLLWGIVVVCSAASQSYAGYIVCRVLLGAGESVIVTSFQVTTSQFFPKHQHFAAGGMVWTCFNGLTVILVNAVGYGLMIKDWTLGRWRIIHLIFGALTIVSGIAYFAVVPNTPEQAWFLTGAEKRALLVRIRGNQQGYGNSKIKWYQIREIVTSDAVHTILILLNVFTCITIFGAMATFQNTLVKQVVDSDSQSLLMTIPGGACQIVGCGLISILSLWGVFSKCRSAYMIPAGAINVLCCCFIAWGPNTAAKLSGIWIWNWVSNVSFGGMLSMVTSNVAGHTKKITVSALTLVLYSAAHVSGPQMFKDSEKESGYPSAKEAMAALSVVSFVLQIVLLCFYIIKNRYRERTFGPVTLTKATTTTDMDLTDVENKNFRYSY